MGQRTRRLSENGYFPQSLRLPVRVRTQTGQAHPPEADSTHKRPPQDGILEPVFIIFLRVLDVIMQTAALLP